jgi:hypothetical protein
VPPLTGDAEKVIDEPAHIGFEPEVIEVDIEGVTIGLTVIVIEFELTVAGLAHDAFDVKAQLTTCPFARVVLVKVVLFVPTFEPFTFHW